MATLAPETYGLERQVVRLPHTQHVMIEQGQDDISKHCVWDSEEQEMHSIYWSAAILKSCQTDIL